MNREKRIEEKDLILPALAVIEMQPGISTSALIQELEIIFHPEGEDARILAGRRDTKFSQKVRNLKSHRENNRMDRFTEYKSGRYTLKEEGRQYLDAHRETVEYVMGNPFLYEDVQELLRAEQEAKRKVYILEEDGMISEGASRKTAHIRKKRSKALRDAAMEYYKDGDGHIRCAVCGFDFYAVYGELGRDFIEFHHENPIYQLGSRGEEMRLGEAVKKVKPVCPNCHRMLHRKRNRVLTIEELKKRIEDQKK